MCWGSLFNYLNEKGFSTLFTLVKIQMFVNIVIQSTAGGVISIAELPDSKFIHPQAGITGFGIGVKGRGAFFSAGKRLLD